MASSPRSFAERVRRNHALEHATLHVLSREIPNLNVVGRSDWEGFVVYGEVPLRTLERAAHEGWERLRNGEVHLSVHPQCGTNLAVAGVLAGAAMLIGLLVSRDGRRRRWPLTALSVMGAVFLSAPLGPVVQRRLTTNPDMEGVFIAGVSQVRGGRWPTYRVRIEHEG